MSVVMSKDVCCIRKWSEESIFCLLYSNVDTKICICWNEFTAGKKFTYLYWNFIQLRGNYPLKDLSTRYNMSATHISRILITWYDFLHTKFRKLPIWATRKSIDDTMPKSFKMLYPKTRVILDCYEANQQHFQITNIIIL